MRAVDPSKLDARSFVQLLEVFDALAKADTGIDLSTVETATLVTLIGRASNEQLAALGQSPAARNLVFGEVFLRMKQHLRADRAASADGVIRWRISGGTGEDGYDRFHTVISSGDCLTTVECDEQPLVTLTLTPVDFLRLTTGTGSVATMVAARRLKIRGDLRYGIRISGLFDIPRPRKKTA